jgi:prevent-host-death family protein
MAIDENCVPTRYSIAQARDHLPRIIHAAESGTPIELTRRGQAVAVIVSLQEYRRLTLGRSDFWTAYERFSAGSLGEEDIGAEVFEGLRDRSPGRETEW